MILVLKAGLNDSAVEAVKGRLTQLQLDYQAVRSFERTVVVITVDARTVPSHLLSQIEGVEKLVNTQPRCPHSMSDSNAAGRFDGTIFGGDTPFVIAGPCSVESRAQLLETAQAVKKAGGHALRGGAFKPRTSPYDFSGLGREALSYLKEARQETGLPVVCEVLSPEQIEISYDYIDTFQIGARNMYNYELLREVGKTDKPVLLKRAMSATIDEFLQAAEYILLQGNLRVVLCERGIRTFETRTRNTLDLNAVALLKTLTKLPVVVDPSHGTGRSDLVRPMSRAAIACGADGLLIETHCQPGKSISDAEQAITPDTLKAIVAEAKAIAQLLNSTLPPAVTLANPPRALASHL